MRTFHESLRCLALNDERFIRSVLTQDTHDTGMSHLDQKTQALVRLGGLLATGGSQATIQQSVDSALAAGASDDEIVGALIALTPNLGVSKVVAMAPELGLALGYDVEEALESLDDRK